MDTKVTPKKETSQVELNITVPAADFAPYLNKAAKKLSTDRPIKGFRPGKAPVKIVAKVTGQERLLQEAMNAALPHFFVQAAADHNLEVINRPSITIHELSLAGPLRFTAVADVLPEVTVGNPADIKAKKRPATVTDDEIEQELKYLAKTRSNLIDVARPAQDGDTVTIDFEVIMNGVGIEGSHSKNHPVHIGEGHFVPGFEQKLIGISAGDRRQFDITFPKNFANTQLQGKRAQVKVKAHRVQKRVMPKIDDAFARRLGKFESLADLRSKLAANMMYEKEHKETERYHAELMEQLANVSQFGFIPEILIEKEINRRLEAFSQMLAYQHKTLDDYVAQQKKTLADMRADMRASATKSVKAALALRAFAKQQNITVTDEELETKTNEYLQRFSSVKEAARQLDPHDLKENIHNILRNQKTLQRLEQLVEAKA